MEKSVKDKQKKILSLAESARILSVSTATLKNWVRLNKISALENNSFYEEDILEYLKKIESGKISSLKSRRNKKKADGTALYSDYIKNQNNTDIIKNIIKNTKEISEKNLRSLLARCAVEIFASRLRLREEATDIYGDFLSHRLSFGTYDALIYELIGENNLYNSDKNKLGFEYCENEDTLGMLYISLSSLKKRKNSGAYFTPSVLVKSSVEKYKKYIEGDNKKILDPCCGSGNFLIYISQFVPLNNLFGFDTDEISICLARISLAVAVLPKDISVLYNNIKCKNSLSEKIEGEFDAIVGNPPWGSEIKNKEFSESAEIFTIFSLFALKDGGKLFFILPESLTLTASHEKFRSWVLEKSSVKLVMEIKNAFAGVQCPAILLGLEKRKNETECEVYIDECKYIIRRSDAFSPKAFLFNISDNEAKIIKKIDSQNAERLASQCEFALGIVTGDNKNILEDKKTSFNTGILRGRDINKFVYTQPQKFVEFNKEKFQQLAPEKYYFAEEKLIYRFISSVPVFAFDDKKMLTLNSANILIPHIEDMDIKYILAVLNSSVAKFYFIKKYKTLKILRSHIENFPIPKAEKSVQKKIIEAVNGILIGGNIEEFSSADEIIMDLYSLTNEEKDVIRKTE